MKRKLLLFILWLLASLAVWAQPQDTLPRLRPRPIIRPLGADSVVMPRAAFLKYDLARQALLELSFEDIDALINVQKQQLATCEQAKDSIYRMATYALHLARDSLRSAQQQLRQINQQARSAADHVSSAGESIHQATADVRQTRRRLWWDRLKAGGAGAALGLALREIVVLVFR